MDLDRSAKTTLSSLAWFLVDPPHHHHNNNPLVRVFSWPNCMHAAAVHSCIHLCFPAFHIAVRPCHALSNPLRSRLSATDSPGPPTHSLTCSQFPDQLLVFIAAHSTHSLPDCLLCFPVLPAWFWLPARFGVLPFSCFICLPVTDHCHCPDFPFLLFTSARWASIKVSCF